MALCAEETAASVTVQVHEVLWGDLRQKEGGGDRAPLISAGRDRRGQQACMMGWRRILYGASLLGKQMDGCSRQRHDMDEAGRLLSAESLACCCPMVRCCTPQGVSAACIVYNIKCPSTRVQGRAYAQAQACVQQGRA
jgi:hypothetical protein